MIKINPLTALLVLEVLCLLAAGLIILFLQHVKLRRSHTSSLRELLDAKQSLKEALKQRDEARREAAAALTGTPAGPEVAGKGAAQESADLKARLQTVEDELREKNRKMEQLQAKFADLEKEYMVLYQQQQSQQPQPDIK